MVKRIIFTIIFSISTFFIFSSQKEIKDNNYLNVSKYNDDIYKISYIDPYYGYMAMGIFGIIFMPTGHGVIIGGVFLGFNAFIYLYAKANGKDPYKYLKELFEKIPMQKPTKITKNFYLITTPTYSTNNLRRAQPELIWRIHINS